MLGTNKCIGRCYQLRKILVFGQVLTVGSLLASRNQSTLLITFEIIYTCYVRYYFEGIVRKPLSILSGEIIEPTLKEECFQVSKEHGCLYFSGCVFRDTGR